MQLAVNPPLSGQYFLHRWVGVIISLVARQLHCFSPRMALGNSSLPRLLKTFIQLAACCTRPS